MGVCVLPGLIKTVTQQSCNWALQGVSYRIPRCWSIYSNSQAFLWEMWLSRPSWRAPAHLGCGESSRGFGDAVVKAGAPHDRCVIIKWCPLFFFFFSLSAACYLGVATQCWRCCTPSPGSTPSFLCCQLACWTSVAPPHRLSLACWLLAYPSCWSFLSRRSVRCRAYEMYVLYLPPPTPFF